MADFLRATAHRPWPLPNTGWILSQHWRDLAYLHYRVDAAAIQRQLPAGLTVQKFDGSAWVGVVPFRMENVAPRGFPALAAISTFPELNVRTYVEAEGKGGVWFFSLDAMSRITVWGGRQLYGLPYFQATMTLTRDGAGWTHCTSQRQGGGPRFTARYRATGAPYFAAPGSFEHWSAERYCLYSVRRPGQLLRLGVHHGPWPLQPAEVVIERSELLAAAGLEPDGDEVRCHCSTGVEVVSFPPDIVSG